MTEPNAPYQTPPRTGYNVIGHWKDGRPCLFAGTVTRATLQPQDIIQTEDGQYARAIEDGRRGISLYFCAQEVEAALDTAVSELWSAVRLQERRPVEAL